MTSGQLTILCSACFILGWSLTNIFSSSYKRHRIMRRIGCFFGRHVPGRVQPAIGGRNVQRCDYCDKIVREHNVTKDQVRRMW